MKIYAVQYEADGESSLNLDVYDTQAAAEANALSRATESVADMNLALSEDDVLYEVEVNNYDGTTCYQVLDGENYYIENWKIVELTLHSSVQ
jgi:uncharacterized membrane protein YkoI